MSSFGISFSAASGWVGSRGGGWSTSSGNDHNHIKTMMLTKVMMVMVVIMVMIVVFTCGGQPGIRGSMRILVGTTLSIS